MKWGATFILLAVAAAGGCLMVAGVVLRILYAEVALAFCGVGIAYLLNKPRALLKQSDGSLSVWSWLVYWPYHLLSWLSLSAYRVVSSEPAFHEIIPGLYLGCRLRSKDTTEILQRGPLSVLDLTSEFAELPSLRNDGSYRCLPLLDHTAPTVDQLSDGIAFIDQRLRLGNVLVHCAVGHGRSAAVVAGFLVATEATRTLDEAVALLRSKRPGVQLNPAQRQALLCLESHLNHHERRDL